MPRTVKYEHKIVKSVRGADKFIVGKMATDGWELIDSVPGRVSTTLSFRRPRKPLNRLAVFGASAAVLALAIIIGVGSVLEDRGTRREADPQPTTRSSTAALDREPTSQPEKQLEPDPQPTNRSSTVAPDKEPSSRPTKQIEPEILTVENSADLAAVLAGPKRGRTVEAFSEKYRVRVVEFDAFVTEVYLNPREALGESNISLRAGDFKDKTHTGPVFQFSWYGHDSPMERFPVGTSVRVRAMVGAVYDFDPHQLFLVTDEQDALTAR